MRRAVRSRLSFARCCSDGPFALFLTWVPRLELIPNFGGSPLLDAVKANPDDSTRNHLLAALADGDFGRVNSHLESGVTRPWSGSL